MFGQPLAQLPVCPTLDKIMHFCPRFTYEEMHWDRDLSSHRGAEVPHQGILGAKASEGQCDSAAFLILKLGPAKHLLR